MKLLVVLTLLSFYSLCSASGRPMAGGWSPIKNIADPHVTDLAGFAVDQHDKEAGDKLVFQKVTKGEQQVVAGMNYRLTLQAKDENGEMGNYQAVVWEKAWAGSRQLNSFNPV